jgi:aminotransferase EvaB
VCEDDSEEGLMPIKVWDYLAEYEAEREDILGAVDRVFRSGRLILGRSVWEFEKAFAAYCGARHGIGVDNGTNALFLALKALGVEPGDEVITVANTAVPTVSAIAAAGAIPVFVDIDPCTYLMDTRLVESAITSRTKCLLPVHLFGQCVDMQALTAIARKHSLKLLEDCSQCHGAAQGGRPAGSFGDAAAFSLYPTKTLGAYGDGGIILTNEDSLNHRVRRLRFYGMDGFGMGDPGVREAKAKYYAEESGYNSRLDEVQAEILLHKLGRLDQYIARRRELAERYRQMLGSTSLGLPQTAHGNDHVYYLYVCRHAERDRILTEMAARDVFLNVSYLWPIHTMRGYAHLGYKDGDLPHTETAAQQIFSLPMYPSLSDADQETVCRRLGEVLGEQVSI